MANKNENKLNKQKYELIEWSRQWKREGLKQREKNWLKENGSLINRRDNKNIIPQIMWRLVGTWFPRNTTKYELYANNNKRKTEAINGKRKKIRKSFHKKKYKKCNENADRENRI